MNDKTEMEVRPFSKHLTSISDLPNFSPRHIVKKQRVKVLTESSSTAPLKEAVALILMKQFLLN